MHRGLADGSIYPAMLMHFMNNALSVVISFCPEQIGKVFPVFYKSTFSLADSLLLLGGGTVLAGIGMVMLTEGRQRKRERKNDTGRILW